MKTSPLRHACTAICLFLSLLGVASAAEPSVVPMGDSTFSITEQAGNAFKRDTETLKDNVKNEAEKYCAAQGKEMKIVSLTAEKPFFFMGYAKAKIVFKALAAGDPELIAPSAPTITVGGTQVQSSSGDMYSDLIKLNDLRTKGILTDAEFETEKKKILKKNR